MVSIVNREDISNLDSKEYDANSIKHLDTREAMRSRIQMYLGTSDDDGVYQSFKEIVNNATDEILAGYGNSIEIMIDEDNNIATIRDYGRGVPFGIRDDGTNVLVSIFTEAHTGGKFDKSSYKNSSGLNGIGGTACNMSSEFFKVESIRDGINHYAYFEEGILKDYREIKTSEKTGTRITFKPDKKVFIYMENGFVYDRICEEIKNISYLNKGVKFILNNGKKEDVFYSENGIVDFINDKVKKPLMSKPIYAEASDGTDKVEIAFIWTKEVGKSYVIANSLNCPELGSPATGAKRTLTNTVRKLARNKELSTELIRKGLFYIVNCTVLEPSFANQTKSKITNPNLATLTSEAFKKGLEEFERIPEFSSIIEMMLKLEKAEHAAEKAREAVLNHTKEMLDLRKQKLAFIDKLSDAENLGENATLCIVEGDSAGGSVALGRDTKNYGILRLRGKDFAH